MKCPHCGGSGSRAGAREAFRPRSGCVYAQADFPQLELYTFAQCCMSWFGFSKLAEALNAGLDPHLEVASRIVGGLTYDEAKIALKDKTHPKSKPIKEARGAAKPLNFGLPGGLGVDSYVDYAWKGYGVRVAPERAKELKEIWFEAWPEAKPYFARINALCANESRRATVETLFTKRSRGNATYCAACNNGFQALGADIAKRAGWLIARAQFVGTPSSWWAKQHSGERSPLFGGRAVAMIHDEFISEVRRDERAHDAAYEQSDLMVDAANEHLPDVPLVRAKMEPTLMDLWSKRAEQVFDDRGRLVPWAA